MTISRTSDGYVIPTSTTAGVSTNIGQGLGQGQGQGDADHSTTIPITTTNQEVSDAEIDMRKEDAEKKDTTSINTKVGLTSKIKSLLREEENELPQWTAGKYRSQFNPYVTSKGIYVSICTDLYLYPFHRICHMSRS